jgi:S-adenosylmethionine:tRNA ribosyltransferase-isomerase
VSLSLSDFRFNYPEDLIARHPPLTRGDSRLLVLNKTNGHTTHQKFCDLPAHFQKGDVLILNDTRVFPARLLTQRSSGGKQEILLVRKIDEANNWEVLLNANTKIKAGAEFAFENLTITIIDDASDDKPTRLAQLKFDGDLMSILKRIGHVPLPPYLGRSDISADQDRYQTVFAEQTGSVAAPTAGLHFTDELLAALKDLGVIIAHVTLHVGPGTFLPVRTEKIQDHKMHTEVFSLSKETCQIINSAKKDNRRITAVGTTSVRVLESVAARNTEMIAQNGQTDIFIYPPYEFKIVDRLITNFHQPESTLLMLVSAFAGREKILAAYQEAVALKYRLFSYGDAMLIG